MINKELENIEKELGIDLVIFFKALKNGVFYKTEINQIYYSSVYLYDLSINKRQSLKEFAFITFDKTLLLFNNYNKTWALTKEELENEK